MKPEGKFLGSSWVRAAAYNITGSPFVYEAVHTLQISQEIAMHGTEETEHWKGSSGWKHRHPYAYGFLRYTGLAVADPKMPAEYRIFGGMYVLGNLLGIGVLGFLIDPFQWHPGGSDEWLLEQPEFAELPEEEYHPSYYGDQWDS